MKKLILLFIVASLSCFVHAQSRNTHDTANLKLAKNNPYDNLLSFDILPIFSGGISTTFAYQHKIGWGQFVRKDRSYYYDIAVSLNNLIPVSNKLIADTSVSNGISFSFSNLNPGLSNAISIGAGVAYNLDRFQLEYGAGIFMGTNNQTYNTTVINSGMQDISVKQSAHYFTIGIEPTFGIRFFIAPHFALSLNGAIPISFNIQKLDVAYTQDGGKNEVQSKQDQIRIYTAPFRSLGLEFHF